MLSTRTYQRRIQKLTEMLRHCQWVQPMYNGSPSCSYCGDQQHLHEDCELSKMLKTSNPRSRDD